MKEWIYGRYPVLEALRANRRQFFRLRVSEGITSSSSKPDSRIQEITRQASSLGLPVEVFPRQKMESLYPGSQGIAIEVSGYPYSNLADILLLAEDNNERVWILILDALQDPQNLGTLLRTAEITGVHGVLLPYRQTATITPAVVNASSGASEYMLVAQVNLAQAITSLKMEGVWVIGLEEDENSELLGDVRLDGPIALVVGSEGQGMRKLVRDSCDVLLRLPMRGRIASLNAAVAGSVALYFTWQARGFS